MWKVVVRSWFLNGTKAKRRSELLRSAEQLCGSQPPPPEEPRGPPTFDHDAALATLGGESQMLTRLMREFIDHSTRALCAAARVAIRR